MNRKQRRAMKKHAGKELSEKISNKILQFDKLPEQCNICEKEFNRKDMEMIKTWSVVVKQELVRLFCPDCVNKAKEILGHVQNTTNR